MLISKKIIETDKDNILIKFLDEQLEAIAEKSKGKSKAAKIRWDKYREEKSKSSAGKNADAMHVHTDAMQNNAEKKRVEKKREEKSIGDRKIQFKELLKPFLASYSKDLLNDFFYYWTEHGVKDKKMKFEKEKSYSVEHRLRTWSKNEIKFNPKKANNDMSFLDKYKKI